MSDPLCYLSTRLLGLQFNAPWRRKGWLLIWIQSIFPLNRNCGFIIIGIFSDSVYLSEDLVRIHRTVLELNGFVFTVLSIILLLLLLCLAKLYPAAVKRVKERGGVGSKSTWFSGLVILPHTCSIQVSYTALDFNLESKYRYLQIAVDWIKIHKGILRLCYCWVGIKIVL